MLSVLVLLKNSNLLFKLAISFCLSTSNEEILNLNNSFSFSKFWWLVSASHLSLS